MPMLTKAPGRTPAGGVTASTVTLTVPVAVSTTGAIWRIRPVKLSSALAAESDTYFPTLFELDDVTLGQVDPGHKRIVVGHGEELVARAQMLALGDEPFGDAGREGGPNHGLGQQPLGFRDLLACDLVFHLQLVVGFGRDQPLIEAVPLARSSAALALEALSSTLLRAILASS